MVGMPQWSEDDQRFAKAFQHELGQKEQGLQTIIREGGRRGEQAAPGGASDDIGDVSWNVPTVVIRFPSNIPGGPGHNWANAISMATPIAHKGATAGAKVMALTIIDLLTKPEIIKSAWARSASGTIGTPA
jgi:aminobenzoyl-glutamate utilization protein B